MFLGSQFVVIYSTRIDLPPLLDFIISHLTVHNCPFAVFIVYNAVFIVYNFSKCQLRCAVCVSCQRCHKYVDLF
jgi:hypothetical protein